MTPTTKGRRAIKSGGEAERVAVRSKGDIQTDQSKRVGGDSYPRLSNTKISLNSHYACVGSVALVMSDSATPWTVVCQAPLSTGFSRQEH